MLRDILVFIEWKKEWTFSLCYFGSETTDHPFHRHPDTWPETHNLKLFIIRSHFAEISFLAAQLFGLCIIPNVGDSSHKAIYV